MSTLPIITVDGPAASGKGAVASLVANQLGFNYLDSGSIYRALAWLSREQVISPSDENALCQLLLNADINVLNGEVRVGQQDIKPHIRSEEIGVLASTIAVLPAVRQALTRYFRSLVMPPGLVADGRDMGTVVFPQAQLKIFLEADVAIRAKRRALQLLSPTEKPDVLASRIAGLKKVLETRDQQDRQRAHAPLSMATDARLLDSTDLSLHQVVEQVLTWWRDLNGSK